MSAMSEDVGSFPMMVWDSLPRAGGSQVHPHLHVSLTRHRYPGKMAAEGEVWGWRNLESGRLEE